MRGASVIATWSVSDVHSVKANILLTPPIPASLQGKTTPSSGRPVTPPLPPPPILSGARLWRKEPPAHTHHTSRLTLVVFKLRLVVLLLLFVHSSFPFRSPLLFCSPSSSRLSSSRTVPVFCCDGFGGGGAAVFFSDKRYTSPSAHAFTINKWQTQLSCRNVGFYFTKGYVNCTWLKNGREVDKDEHPLNVQRQFLINSTAVTCKCSMLFIWFIQVLFFKLVQFLYGLVRSHADSVAQSCLGFCSQLGRLC